MANSCDNCGNDCIHLDNCISELYRDVLKRCNVDILDKTETSPEVPRNANNNRSEEELYGEGIGFQRLRRI